MTGRMRRLKLPVLAAGLLVALGLLLNVGGWRARIVARLLRIDNDPIVVLPPPDFQPRVPAGFKVSVFAAEIQQPRWLAVAPNGDVFVADSSGGQVVVLGEGPGLGQPASRAVFADGLKLPFGIAFHDGYVYIANTNEVVRFRYDPKTSKRLGPAEHILDLPGLGYRQHWTRTIAFDSSGRLFVSIGSRTNISIESDPRRAAILVADPDGKNMRVYASGLRNAVGMAFQPETGQLWATVNERDDLGEDIPADYFTHVVEGGFYGWPYSYLGPHVDNRVASRPDLVRKAIVPDLCWVPTWRRCSLYSTKDSSSPRSTDTVCLSPSTVRRTGASGAGIRSCLSHSGTALPPESQPCSFPGWWLSPQVRMSTDARSGWPLTGMDPS